jgi:hypothetical protein
VQEARLLSVQELLSSSTMVLYNELAKRNPTLPWLFSIKLGRTLDVRDVNVKDLDVDVSIEG